MSDKMIEAVAKAICQANIDANSTPKPNSIGFFRTAIDGPLWLSFTVDAQIVLDAIEASGYAVVPKEPTEEMCNVNFSHAFFTPNDMPDDDNWRPDVIYAAMISAAPKVTP